MNAFDLAVAGGITLISVGGMVVVVQRSRADLGGQMPRLLALGAAVFAVAVAVPALLATDMRDIVLILLAGATSTLAAIGASRTDERWMQVSLILAMVTGGILLVIMALQIWRP